MSTLLMIPLGFGSMVCVVFCVYAVVGGSMLAGMCLFSRLLDLSRRKWPSEGFGFVDLLHKTMQEARLRVNTKVEYGCYLLALLAIIANPLAGCYFVALGAAGPPAVCAIGYVIDWPELFTTHDLVVNTD